MRIKHKLLLFIGLPVLVLLGVGLVVLSNTPLWPHKRITLGLPFTLDNPPTGLIPMGETIMHPKPASPHGHPGIDFGWNHDAQLVAAVDGKITKIAQHGDDPNYIDVDLSTGIYRIGYQELSGVAPGVTKSAHLKKGQPIGYITAVANNPPGSPPHSNLHWEFDYAVPFYDRICPMTYFDPASREFLEQLWASIPDTDQFKSQFPDICSGDYKGKDQ